MKKYEYVKINGWHFAFGFDIDDEHRSIIDQHASDGWRYVGFIPTRDTDNGLTEIDLIFEKDID